MTAIDFMVLLKTNKSVPWSRERSGYPTNSEMRRWLNDRSVVINGKTPKPFEDVSFPVSDVVFFPKSKGRVTIH